MGAGFTATGVIVRIRATGAEYGMHDACADALMTQLAAAGHSVMDDDMPAVIVGPLFADVSEWACAHSRCTFPRVESARALVDTV
ncbi:hypothetical protein GCM10009862_15970 [Microbacterium binotii]|uniref:Uncharacterized protein n=1 Tax=Microbacterium binotii TaxID=462710 RepID=A0ABN3PBI3_9MICO